MNDCPIARYKTKLVLDNKDVEAEFARLEAAIHEEINDAFEVALSSRKPTTDDAWGKVYA